MLFTYELQTIQDCFITMTEDMKLFHFPFVHSEQKAMEHEEIANGRQAEEVGDFSRLHWIGEDTADMDTHTRLSTGGGQGGEESYINEVFQESRAWWAKRELLQQKALQKRPPS